MKAAEALAMVGKILPKAAAFFAKRQDALKVVERYADAAPGCLQPRNVLSSQRFSTTGSLRINTTSYRSGPNGPNVHLASSSCSVPTPNPAFGPKRPRSSELGRYGELAAGLDPKAKKEFLDVVDDNNNVIRQRIPDGIRNNCLVEVKNVKCLRPPFS